MLALLLACWIIEDHEEGGSPIEADADADTDADTDADGDTDADSDSDADGDSDADTDLEPDKWVDDVVDLTLLGQGPGGAGPLALPDLDGDGVRELAVGAPVGAQGRGQVFLVKSPGAGQLELAAGDHVVELYGAFSSGNLGAQLAVGGDELVLSNHDISNNESFVYSLSSWPEDGQVDEVATLAWTGGGSAGFVGVNSSSTRWLAVSLGWQALIMPAGDAHFTVRPPQGTILRNGPGNAALLERDQPVVLLVSQASGSYNTAYWTEGAFDEAGSLELEEQDRFTYLDSVWGVGDLDGDGEEDLVASHSGGDGVVSVYTRLYGGASDMRGAEDRIENDAGRGLGVFVRAEDVDGDGLSDLLMSSTSGEVLLVWGDGIGGVLDSEDLGDAGLWLSCPDPVYCGTYADLGDLDGDGYADLVLSDTGAGDDAGAVYVLLSGL